MSRTKRITDSIRAQVLELREKGYTLKAIAIELDISLSSVKRFKAEGSKNKIKGSSSEVQNLNIEVQDEMQTSSLQIKGSSSENKSEESSNMEKNFEKRLSKIETEKNLLKKDFEILKEKIVCLEKLLLEIKEIVSISSAEVTDINKNENRKKRKGKLLIDEDGSEWYSLESE